MDKPKGMSADAFFDSMFESDVDKKALTDHLNARKIISTLAAKRASKGLSQSDLADALGCNQPKISKLESGTDAALTVGEIEGYAKAIGLDVTILVSDRQMGLAEQIKFHAISIRNAFLNLVEQTHHQDLIAMGVASLHMEAFQNINRFLAETAEKLPGAEDDVPHLRFVSANDSKQPHSEANPASKRRSPRKVKRNPNNAAT